MIRSEFFTFENKEYEVRCWLVGGTYKVKVFFNKEPVNGYNYNVSFENVIDLKKGKYPQSLLDNLISIAKNDILEKKWEEYLESIVDWYSKLKLK